MAEKGLDVLRTSPRRQRQRQTDTICSEDDSDEIIEYHHQNMPDVLDQALRFVDKMKDFFQNHEIGKGVSVVLPFAGLILIGAVVVGPVEEWTFLEAVYFSVVSLTTVGFGDYVPTENFTILFCIIWLPFSVGFMSMYLGNVAAFYIRLSDRNIRRIERHMRRRLQRAKDQAERERAEVLRRAYRGQEVEIIAAAGSLSDAGDDNSSVASKDIEANGIPANHAQSIVRRQAQGVSGFDALPTNDGSTFGDPDGPEEQTIFDPTAEEIGNQRRQRILENHAMTSGTNGDGVTMQSMRDVIRRVNHNLNASKKTDGSKEGVIRSGPDVKFMSIRSNQRMTTQNVHSRKPSFALRVLVQERFAEIIATDIAGYQSAMEIEGTTLHVTIDSLKGITDKWVIPRRARKPFRSVAFEVLCFVGEHGLITRGADALYDLSPFEFHGLFSPLVAAMGDADTMERWLESTDVLAAADLAREGILRPGRPLSKGPSSHGTQRTRAVPKVRVEETPAPQSIQPVPDAQETPITNASPPRAPKAAAQSTPVIKNTTTSAATISSPPKIKAPPGSSPSKKEETTTAEEDEVSL